MRLNAKGTVGSFRGRKLIYNKIITSGGGGMANKRSLFTELCDDLDTSLQFTYPFVIMQASYRIHSLDLPF